jgi:hypothetical protein
MFQLKSLSQSIQPQFRGIAALNNNLDANPLRRRNSQSDPHRQRLDIHQIEITPGHISCSFQSGKLFAVFDAISSSEQQLSDAEQDKLAAFLSSSDQQISIHSMLALRTTNSNIIKMQFIPPETLPNAAASSKTPTNTAQSLRLLVIQANSTFLIWEFLQNQWNFISRGVLSPLPGGVTCAQNVHAERAIDSAVYHVATRQLFWLELISPTYFQICGAKIENIGLRLLGEVLPCGATLILPLSCPQKQKFTLQPGRAGLFIFVKNSRDFLYYYSFASAHLTKVLLPGAENSAKTVRMCWNYAQGQLNLLDSEYNLISLVESSQNNGVEVVTKCKFEYSGQFPSEIIAFRHIVCFFTPKKLFFFTNIGGILLESIDNRANQEETSEISTAQCRLGFGSSGTVAFDRQNVFFIHCGPVANQLKAIERLSSPQSTETSEKTRNSTVPGLPSAYSSCLTADFASTYPSSLAPQLQSAQVSRVLAKLTSNSSELALPNNSLSASWLSQLENPLNNAWLAEILENLSSPALPMAAAGLKSAQNLPNLYEFDAIQANLLQKKLEIYISALKPLAEALTEAKIRKGSGENSRNITKTLKPPKKQGILGQTSLSSTDSSSNSSPEHKAAPNSAKTDPNALRLSPAPELSPQTPEISSIVSLFNLNLLPIVTAQLDLLRELHSVRELRALSQKGSEISRNQAESMRNQLERSLADRMTAMISGNKSNRSLKSLLLFDSEASLDFLQQILGFKAEKITEKSEIGAILSENSPNLLLLNEELKQNRENEHNNNSAEPQINEFLLSRSDSEPFFEILCRLYDEIRPAQLISFINLVKQLNSANFPQNQTSSEEIQPLQRSFSAPTDFSSYYSRALAALPALKSLKFSESEGKLAQIVENHMERAKNRAFLLQNSGKTVEALQFWLKLELEEGNLLERFAQQHNLVLKSHELAAIELCELVQRTKLPETELTALKGELFHHFLRYWLEKLIRLTKTGPVPADLAPKAVNSLDHRVLLLAPADFCSQNYLQSARQRLEQREFSTEISGDSAASIILGINQQIQAANIGVSTVSMRKSTVERKSGEFLASPRRSALISAENSANFPEFGGISPFLGENDDDFSVERIRGDLENFAAQLEEKMNSSGSNPLSP